MDLEDLRALCDQPAPGPAGPRPDRRVAAGPCRPRPLRHCGKPKPWLRTGGPCRSGPLPPSPAATKYGIRPIRPVSASQRALAALARCDPAVLAELPRAWTPRRGCPRPDCWRTRPGHLILGAAGPGHFAGRAQRGMRAWPAPMPPLSPPMPPRPARLPWGPATGLELRDPRFGLPYAAVRKPYVQRHDRRGCTASQRGGAAAEHRPRARACQPPRPSRPRPSRHTPAAQTLAGRPHPPLAGALARAPTLRLSRLPLT